jgi:hypothetical protein
MKALGVSWKTGELFKESIERKLGKPFEAYTALGMIPQIPADLKLLLVHDEEDRDVSIKHAIELGKVFPSQALFTKGLGHNRILKDDEVIRLIVDFIKKY